MHTDITLHKGNRKLIIDTKYYGKVMQEHYNKESFNSINLYQMFAYVKNLDKDCSGDVSGLILYAKTQEDFSSLDAVVSGNRIRIQSLDLNTDFSEIKRQLDEIIETEFC